MARDLLQKKYWTQSNISITVTWWWIGEKGVSNQNNDFEGVENDSFWEYVWEHWIWARTMQMSSDEDSDDGIKHLLKLSPS